MCKVTMLTMVLSYADIQSEVVHSETDDDRGAPLLRILALMLLNGVRMSHRNVKWRPEITP